jgi:oxygen-independent coproporphyrinogen III oxidase
MPELGVYLHAPFCRSKCLYCDFNSYAGRGDLLDEYAAALGAEIKGGYGRSFLPAGGDRVSTIYLGGGNPALLGRAVGGLLDDCRRYLPVIDEPEITVELNPEDAQPEFLAFLKERGVNRLSIGWQSLDDGRLARLGRRHSAQEAVNSLAHARLAGFDNINVDLIFGLPGQTLDDWRAEIQAAAGLGPEHLSAYALSVEPGTPLAAQAAGGDIGLPDEDTVAAMYEAARRLLMERGYRHYEISNFARPGRECRHNLNYWRGGDYLGFGAGAHAHVNGRRWWCHRGIAEFIAGSKAGTAVAGEERVDGIQRLSERLMLGLRLTEGVDVRGLENEFDVKLADMFGRTIDLGRERGLINTGPIMALTEKGLLLANEVMVGFV